MNAGQALPAGWLLSFYGDDYTGSSAVMEVLSFAGLPTVLFLEPPSPSDLARFAAYRGIGVAGIARAQSPAWMDANLPGVFRTLAALGAPIAHYKVCSTFELRAGCGFDRSGDRPRGSGAGRRLASASGGRAGARTLPGVRQLVRRGR